MDDSTLSQGPFGDGEALLSENASLQLGAGTACAGSIGVPDVLNDEKDHLH